MKLTEHPNEDGELVTFLEFSHDEEHAVARWVMAMLACRWMPSFESLQKLLHQIIYRKSRGRDIYVEQFEEIGRLCERANRYDIDMPEFPKLKLNDSRIMAPKELHGSDAVEWVRQTVSDIWYAEWQQNEDMRRRVNMWVFPNREPGEEYYEYQYKLEERFWLEVDRRQEEYECSRAQAIIAVSDHMKRADIENQLPDPSFDDS